MKNYTLILVGIFALFLFNANSQILISQGGTVPVNNGDLFYDAGGAAGNDNNTNYTITLTPAVVGERICLEFTSFNTYYGGSNQGDFVNIYDANTTTAAAQIAQITGDFSTFTAAGGMGLKITNGLAAYNTPGIFCSNNASGSLTISFQNNNATVKPGFAAKITTYKPLGVPGCNISMTASPTTICSGQTVTLTATGNIVSSAFSNDFNTGTVGTGWQATASANFTNPVCAVTGQDGIAHASTFLWMSNAAFPRDLTTNPMNVSSGGTISFDYRQAIQASSSPCEGPDLNFSGQTPEGVYLQYSTNGGTNWTTIDFLFPRDDNENSFGNWYPGTGRFNESWHTKIYPIPTGACTASTMFRWTQQLGTNANSDNWGLDNIVISSPKPTTITIKNLTNGTTLGTSAISPYTITDAPLVTTNYEASITDGITTCTFPVTVTISGSIAAPTVAPISYCQNATPAALTATALAGNTLNWYGTNATGGVASVTAPTPSTAIAGTTTYYVSQVNGTGCESPRAAIVVTVNAMPTLTITNPATACSPATVDITAAAVTTGSTGGTTLTYWSNNIATISISNQAAIPISGTYYIKSTLNGCSDIKSVVVTVNTTPSLSIHDPAAVCSPSTVDITAAAVTTGSTGGGVLSYWTNIGATTTLASPSAIAATGIYYIKSTLGSCTDIKAVNVTVNTTPVLSIHSPAAVCSPATVDITAAAVTAGSTGGGALSYWTNNAATITLASPASISATGTYYIKSLLGSCSDIKSVSVTVNTTPVLSIHDPAAVCSPNTVDITAAAVTAGSTGGGALTYWTNIGATTTLASPSIIASTGTYYIKSTLGSCTDVKAVNVTINTTPSLSIHNPAAVCSPTNVDISLAAITTGSTGGGTLSYWTNAGATTSLLSPSTISSTATYYIKSTLGSCSDIKPVVVTINTTPALTISDPTAVCSPLTIDITAAAVTTGSTGGGTLSYWNDLACTLPLASSNAVATSGTYYIKSTLVSCFDIKPVTVVINNCGCPLTIVTNAPAAVCSPSTINLTQAAVTAGSTGGGALTYWTDAACTSSLATPSAVATSGTYYIKGSNGACSDSKPVVVTINTTPSLSIHDPLAVCSPSTVDFTAAAVTTGSTGGGALSYWTNIGATTSLNNPNAVSITGTFYIKSTLGSCFDIKAVNSVVNTTPSLTIHDPAAVCSPLTVDITNSAVTLGSTGGGTLSYWQDLAVSSSLASPNAVSTSGTYYIKSLLGSCFDIKAVTVTINTTPVLSLHNPTAVCEPNTVDLTASAVTTGSTGGGTLTYWIDAGATQSLIAASAIPSTGTYYIKSSVGLCVDTKPVTVTVNTTPVLSIHSPAAVCIPGTIDITGAAVTTGSTGGGVLSYWNDLAASSSLASPSSISVSNTYYIKSLLGSCFDIEPVTVVVSAAPVLSITNPSSVCSPATVDITLAAVTNGSTGAGTLSYWTDAATTISHVSPTTSNAGTYYIKSTVGSCSDTKSVLVTVVTTPILSITNPNPACPPAVVDITLANVTTGSTGGGTLSYWSNAAGTTSLLTPTAINQTGVYYIKAANGLCTDIKPVNVMLDVPTLSITDPQAVCSPNTINITAPAITTGSTGVTSLTYWSDINCTLALGSPSSINTTGTYYIKASNATCSVSKAVNVTINTTPLLNITNPTGVCFPATVDLTAVAVTAGSTGGGTLSYWNDLAASNLLNGPSVVASSGTYYIKSTSNGCSDVKQVTATINNTPILLISAPPAVCAPGTVDLTQSGITLGSQNLGPKSYYSDLACTIPVATPNAVATAGTYYIKSLSGSCFDIKPVQITINPVPTVIIGNTASGCAPLKVDLTDPTLTAGSTPGITLNYWTNNQATVPLISPTSVSNGTYYITGTLTGCKSAPQKVDVTIYPLPIADFSPTPDLVSTLNPETLFKNQSIGAKSYFWDFGDGKYSAEINPTHTYSDVDTATYNPYLIVTSQFGCIDTIQKKVKVYEELVYYIPNTFTPDEDNFNNTFQPVFVSGFDPYNFTMYIFNRWGELVFESHDAKIGWRGTYGTSTTELAKEGVYTWKINFNLKSDDRRKEITGHVNLVK